MLFRSKDAVFTKQDLSVHYDVDKKAIEKQLLLHLPRAHS
jgi:hypothetical protein